MKKTATFIAVAAGLALGTASGIADNCKKDAAKNKDQVALPLELPKPMFKGTPTPAKVPNLRKPLGKPRPALMVPKGTVLISKDAKVTSSDDLPVIGELEMITDGDKSGADGSFVELGPMKQWVQVDLGAALDMQAICIWHFHSQARIYHDVVVQLADDPDFIEGVDTIFNNDHNNSLGLGVGKDDLAYIETNEGELINVGGKKARYVRLYSNGNTSDEMNHYVEVEIYGKK